MRHMGRATHEARDACYGNRGSECALSRLNRSTRITHSMRTQQAQSEYSDYTLNAHSTGSIGVLGLHTQCTLNRLNRSTRRPPCGRAYREGRRPCAGVSGGGHSRACTISIGRGGVGVHERGRTR